MAEVTATASTDRNSKNPNFINGQSSKTFQDGLKSVDNTNITKYALFLGGLDVTRDVLSAYDPFKTGFGRIFMTRGPVFIENNSDMFNKLRVFKHILEYANTGIDGINDIGVNSADIQGGFAQRTMQVAMSAQNDTNSFTISTYEFSGSPMRELLTYWVTGVSDLQSGFATYHGSDIPVKQSNHTAEFVYVLTDQTGRASNIEFACLFANCYPNGIQMSHLNTRSGDHNIVELQIGFSCTMYFSPKINEIGRKLLEKYQILMDSLDFNPKFDVDTQDFYGGAANPDQPATYYDSEHGTITEPASVLGRTENLGANYNSTVKEIPKNNLAK